MSSTDTPDDWVSKGQTHMISVVYQATKVCNAEQSIVIISVRIGRVCYAKATIRFCALYMDTSCYSVLYPFEVCAIAHNCNKHTYTRHLKTTMVSVTCIQNVAFENCGPHNSVSRVTMAFHSHCSDGLKAARQRWILTGAQPLPHRGHASTFHSL